MKTINTYQAMETSGILLNANESYKNIDNMIIKEIQEAMGNVLFHRYPDDNSTELIEAYSKYIHVDSECIMAGNGSDEMLGTIIGLEIKENKKLYTLSPDFSMYDYYVSMHNGKMIKYQCNVEDDFDVNQFIACGKENKVDMILFSNPNNPTGKVIPQQDLIKIIEAFSNIYVVVDEAYSDFDDTTMLDYINQYPNLLVTRTLSKAFALAGIRCGFLIGNKQTIAKIKPYKVPYNVNRLTQLVGTIALKYVDKVKENIAEIKKERDHLYQQYLLLHREDVKLYPSKTNYLYGVSANKDRLMEAFKQQGIIVRQYQDGSFRITIGSPEQNKRVLEVLKTF